MLYFLLMKKVRVRVRVRLSQFRGACEGACEIFFEVRLCVRSTRKFLATQHLPTFDKNIFENFDFENTLFSKDVPDFRRLCS